MSTILRMMSGAICYPMRDGKHLMVTSTTAHVVTLTDPDRMEVVKVGNGPRDISPEQFLTHMSIVGATLAEMRPRR